MTKTGTTEAMQRQLEVLTLISRNVGLKRLTYIIELAALEADTECQRLRLQQLKIPNNPDG